MTEHSEILGLLVELLTDRDSKKQTDRQTYHLQRNILLVDDKKAANKRLVVDDTVVCNLGLMDAMCCHISFKSFCGLLRNC